LTQILQINLEEVILFVA